MHSNSCPNGNVVGLHAKAKAEAKAKVEGDKTSKNRAQAEEMMSRAKVGDANAQSNLGIMYQNGKGVPQDYVKAVQWYTRSAEQGNRNAQTGLQRLRNK